jgi:hypothetical protein
VMTTAPSASTSVTACCATACSDADLYQNGALLPGPQATLAGPTFEEWLDSTS